MVNPTPFIQAVNALNTLKQIPGYIGYSSSGMHLTVDLFAQLVPTHLWVIALSGPTYPYKVTVNIDGVQFFTFLTDEDAIRYGVCPVAAGEPELPEPTLEEMVIC